MKLALPRLGLRRTFITGDVIDLFGRRFELRRYDKWTDRWTCWCGHEIDRNTLDDCGTLVEDVKS